jgi:AcrR family transcriptional regulator
MSSVGMPSTAHGQRTRAAILQAAAQLASVEGLEGLSIGQLANATDMSKSGLYAHFGSKEELQLATIEAARETFVNDVVRRGLRAPRGVRRLLATCDAFLSHVRRKVFPSGCFFVGAAAEVGTRRGRVHDAIASQQREWVDLLERLARAAQRAAELPTDIDPAQLAFELEAMLVTANILYILHDDESALRRAQDAIYQRLGASAPAIKP